MDAQPSHPTWSSQPTPPSHNSHLGAFLLPRIGEHKVRYEKVALASERMLGSSLGIRMSNGNHKSPT